MAKKKVEIYNFTFGLKCAISTLYLHIHLLEKQCVLQFESVADVQLLII